jgi:tetratricopeptide (TPR) repeat protein
VVLAGITIGNYLGGRIADRFVARKALAVLFGFSSVACVVIVVLNNTVGEWFWLWHFSWPVRVFSHVAIVFLVPSTLLGTISPVVAKMALDKGLPTGRTVGDIYAWGAAGSIAGTFFAGFYLIAAMGTVAIVWTIGGILLLMGIVYYARLWVLYIWAAIFIALMAMGMAPAEWAQNTGSSLALREKPNPNILYEDETHYCHVFVKRLSQNPDRRAFMQDTLRHSDIVMNDIGALQYSYEQIHAAITHRFARDKAKLSTFIIGGGGYVFPRYIEKHWPGSQIDVAEIDAGVTEAAMEAFGLDRDTPIRTFNMDARNHVDQLLEQERTGGVKTRYDFIYEDALSDYSIPFQLTTKEFNDKIATLLGQEGIYLTELIDIFDSGLFLGAYVNTLQETFPFVYVVTEADPPRSYRNTFVVVATKRELDLDNLEKDYKKKHLELWTFTDSDMAQVKTKAGGLVLTDDHAPVENLLASVVRESAGGLLSLLMKQAKELKQQGQWRQSIKKYERAAHFDSPISLISLKAYNEIGLIYAEQGELQRAMQAFQAAIDFHGQGGFDQRIPLIRLNLATILLRMGKDKEAVRHFREAAEEFRAELEKNPDLALIWSQLGNALAGMGDFDTAIGAFRKALDLEPINLAHYNNLVAALQYQGRLIEAIEVLRKGVDFMSRFDQVQARAKLENHLNLLLQKQKSKPK